MIKWQKMGIVFACLVIGGIGGCSVVKNDGLDLPLGQEAIAKKGKEFTVIIDGCGAGSGAIVKREGNTYSVLTAYHVVEKKDLNCLIITPDQETYQVKGDTITKPVADVDLGVLTFTSDKNYPVAKLGDSEKVVEATSIYVLGVPGSSAAISHRTVLFNSGKITGRVPEPKNGYILIYDANTQPGMNGGPVLNHRGEIVGVHAKGDRDEKGIENSWNLGIPIQIFINPETYANLKQQEKKTANDYYSQGIAFFHEKDYAAALGSLDEAIKLDANMGKAFLLRGTAHYFLDNTEKAIADYTKAIERNPQDPANYNLRGNAYTWYKMNKDNLEKAIADYTKAILHPQRFANKLNSKYAEAYNKRGVAYYYLQKYDLAIADYTKAVELDPKFAWAYHNRGLAYYYLQKYNLAIADYTKAIELDPKFAWAYHNNRGNAYYDLKKYELAIADYNKAIALDQNDAMAYNNRGLAYSDLKKYDLAIADYNKAIELDQNYAAAYNNLGLIAETTGDVQTAINNYEKAAALYQQQGDDIWYQNAMNNLKRLRVN